MCLWSEGITYQYEEGTVTAPTPDNPARPPKVPQRQETIVLKRSYPNLLEVPKQKTEHCHFSEPLPFSRTIFSLRVYVKIRLGGRVTGYL